MSFKTNNVPNGEDFSKRLLGKSDKKTRLLFQKENSVQDSTLISLLKSTLVARVRYCNWFCDAEYSLVKYGWLTLQISLLERSREYLK